MKIRRSPWLAVGVFVAAVVVVNLGLRALDEHTHSPGGPASSSFAREARVFPRRSNPTAMPSRPAQREGARARCAAIVANGS